jgi:hypothetical protein
MIAICPEIKMILPQNHSAYLSCFGCGQRPRWADSCVIYDIKSVLPCDIVDARL